MDEPSANCSGSAQRQLPVNAEDTFVCLNFKVPLEVRRQFKIHAARRNMTMTELLLLLLDSCLGSDANRGQPDTPANQEIKK